MTIAELKEKISAIDKQMAELRIQKDEAKEELRQAIQAAFESEHMVKRGDPLMTRMGEKVFYEGFGIDAYKTIVCLCHPCKNDGTASRAVRHFEWTDFA